MNIMACALVPRKTADKTEMWKIDGFELELYRKLNSGLEETIPIKENSDMNRFFCIDEKELEERFGNEL